MISKATLSPGSALATEATLLISRSGQTVTRAPRALAQPAPPSDSVTLALLLLWSGSGVVAPTVATLVTSPVKSGSTVARTVTVAVAPEARLAVEQATCWPVT